MHKEYILYLNCFFSIDEVMSDKSLRFERTCRPSLVPDGQKSCLKKWRYSLNGYSLIPVRC